MNQQARTGQKKPTKSVKRAAQQMWKGARPSLAESDEMNKKRRLDETRMKTILMLCNPPVDMPHQSCQQRSTGMKPWTMTATSGPTSS